MRKFVNATIAGATAVALTFGATSVATAQSSSSEIGAKWNADESAVGTDVWGGEKAPNSELPDWAGNLRSLTYAGVAAAVFGLIVAPAYNFLAYNNILPLPKY